jgi:protein O-GlcNAc transferase
LDKCGIAPERLIFTPPLAKSEHLNRHQLCDVFLDTFICNAHSTASDALWANVPLVTLQGTHFASRVASSLLTHLGLAKLVAHSPQEFEDIAVNLASDRQLLTDLKGSLAQAVKDRLYNTPLHVEQIEKAYLKIWNHYLEGNAPEAVWV